MSSDMSKFGGRLMVKIRPGHRRWLKRSYWKAVRQQARRDLENAPTRKVFKGWYD